MADRDDEIAVEEEEFCEDDPENIIITCCDNTRSWTIPTNALYACPANSLLGRTISGVDVDGSDVFFKYKRGELFLVTAGRTAETFVEIVLGIYQKREVSIEDEASFLYCRTVIGWNVAA